MNRMSISKYLIGIFFLTVILLFQIIYKDQYQPKLFLKKDIVDFGEVFKGDDISTYFLIKNIGTRNLKILNVESTCGCTVANGFKDVIYRNELDSLYVKYDSEILGYFSKEILIYSNDSQSPHRVWITGTVKEPF